MGTRKTNLIQTGYDAGSDEVYMKRGSILRSLSFSDSNPPRALAW